MPITGLSGVLESATDYFKSLVAQGANKNVQQVLEELLGGAARWKPYGYDTEMAKRREYYEGRQLPGLKRALRKRYPNTHSSMDPVALNLIKLIADQDASVYDAHPERWLERDGVRLDKDTLEDEAFQQLLSEAMVSVIMPEAERRLQVTGTIFLRCGWDYRVDQPKIDIFWPHQVHVICTPNNPADLQASVALLAEVVGPEGRDDDVRYFEAWFRTYDETDVGRPIYGPWQVEQWNTRGDRVVPYGNASSPIGGGNILPWVSWNNSMPDGSPFVNADGDLLSVQDAVNVNNSNVMFVADLQAHDQLVYAGASRNDMVAGPGRMLQVGPGETVTSVSHDPAIKEMLDINKNLVRLLAITRRQNPDAYNYDPAPPLSGVSRRIRNESAERARKERVHFTRTMEEKQLLPVLMALSDYHRSTGFADLAPRFRAPDMPEFEAPEVLQQRLIQAVDEGWVTKERAAVLAGFYPTVEEAERGMEGLVSPDEAPRPGSAERPAFRQRLQEIRRPDTLVSEG